MIDNEKEAVLQLQKRIAQQPEGLEKSEVVGILSSNGVVERRYGQITRTAGLKLDSDVDIYKPYVMPHPGGVKPSKAASTSQEPVSQAAPPDEENVLTFRDVEISFNYGPVSVNGKVRKVVIELYP